MDLKKLAALLAVFGILASPASAFHASLPWKTFSAAAVDSVGAGVGSCPQGEIVRALFRRDEKAFVYFYAPESGVWLIYEPDTKIIWFGKADSKDNDSLVPSWHRALTETELEVGPCPLLFPRVS